MDILKTEFYILHSLATYMQEAMRDRRLAFIMDANDAISQTSICFRLIGKGYQILAEDVISSLPSLLERNLIHKFERQFEPYYIITKQGMAHYNLQLSKYNLAVNDSPADVNAINEFMEIQYNATVVDAKEITPSDLEKVREVLYFKYLKTASSTMEWHQMVNNFDTVESVTKLLQEAGKKCFAPLNKVLEKLYDNGIVERKRNSDTILAYRIKGAAVLEYEKKTNEKIAKGIETIITGKSHNSTSTAPVDARVATGKFFISHAVKNKDLSVGFQEKILETGLRVHPDEIFNISVEGSGIESGEHFKQRIEKELRTAKAIILLITPEYKESGACLNEMGAAWMMDGTIPVIPFILGMSHTAVGFIHNPTQHLQMDNKADLYKFVSEAKKNKLIGADYDNGRLDRVLTEFIAIALRGINQPEQIKVEPETLTNPEPKKSPDKPMTKDTPGAKKIQTFPVKGNRAVLEKIIKRLFSASKPETGIFYQLNNQGEYYYFEDSQFHIIPNYETRCFLGWTAEKSHVTLAIIDKYDLIKLTGEPIEDIFDLPVYQDKDLHVWIEYRGKRHKVLNSKLIEKLLPSIKQINSKDLLKMAVGDQFQMSTY